MKFFYKCIIRKVPEQIVDPILVFATNFKVLKMKVKELKKLRSDGC